jgi:acid phosphatase (class A)
VLYEEPTLEQRFGGSYLRYRKSVARWLPHPPAAATTATLLLLWGCASGGGSSAPASGAPSTSTAPSASSSSSASTPPSAEPTPVPEVRPGFLAGYLPAGEAPDSAALLPAPPADGSATKAADVDVYRTTRALRGTARWDLATQDADLTFPNAAGTFSCALGTAITEGATPHLYLLLRRALTDAGAATGGAKRKYQRKRPFVEMNEASCSPNDEGYLRNDGSYPSGHASLGWAWALLLAELAPDHDDAILARGFDYGQSRVICGVHWQSDVNAGRLVGSAVVARLHDDATFRADFDAARTELESARKLGLQPVRDCGVESAALALSGH